MPISHGRYHHTSTIAGIKQINIGKISPRAFRRRIVRCWHPLGCRANELGKNAPGGCDIYPVVYGIHFFVAYGSRFVSALLPPRTHVPNEENALKKLLAHAKDVYTSRIDDLYDLSPLNDLDLSGQMDISLILI